MENLAGRLSSFPSFADLSHDRQTAVTDAFESLSFDDQAGFLAGLPKNPPREQTAALLSLCGAGGALSVTPDGGLKLDVNADKVPQSAPAPVGSGLVDFLKKEYAGVPVWGWGLGGLGVFGIIYLATRGR